MKERIFKLGISLVLVAVLVVAVVCPMMTQAAAKGTTYNVLIDKGSALVTYTSIAGGAASPSASKSDGITFQMVVDAKAKTEKVKSTGQTATYYPVTILAKSWKAPTSRMMMPGGDAALSTTILKKDGKGKYYSTAGGDVDINNVMAKKLVSKIGDGKADPVGSMTIDITMFVTSSLESTKKVFLQLPMALTLTTGKSYVVANGTKTRLDGKAMPDNDTTNTLPKPLVGAPVDLNAGTGTLVSTTGIVGLKNKTLGTMDMLFGQIFVVKISK